MFCYELGKKQEEIQLDVFGRAENIEKVEENRHSALVSFDLMS